MALLFAIMAMVLVSAPAYANTGTTGETTWANGNADPATTNQFSSDSALGCPTTINIWQTDTPVFDGPTYFHVDSIDPTDDPFVHASGPYNATVGSSTPLKIGTIDVATLVKSARDTGQPLDTNGQGYHYRLVFDYYLTSTVDFWVNCADLNPPDPDPTPTPEPTSTPTPGTNPPPDTTVVTVSSPPSDPKTTTPTTGSDTTTSGTPNQCTKFSPNKVKTVYSKKVRKGKVRVSAKVDKSIGVNRILVKVINGKHVKTYGNSDKRKLELKLNVHSKSIWGKKSWKHAYVKVTFYRGCGGYFVRTLR